MLMFGFSFSQATGLHFRHTDNVIQWLNAMAEKGLPKVSRPPARTYKSNHTGGGTLFKLISGICFTCFCRDP